MPIVLFFRDWGRISESSRPVWTTLWDLSQPGYTIRFCLKTDKQKQKHPKQRLEVKYQTLTTIYLCIEIMSDCNFLKASLP